MKINLNDNVRIKLTDYGRLALERQHIAFWWSHKEVPYKPPVEDANGWSKWQFHTLMRELGNLLVVGGPLPFETDMEYDQSN
jgi:hypothetical protein